MTKVDVDELETLSRATPTLLQERIAAACQEIRELRARDDRNVSVIAQLTSQAPQASHHDEISAIRSAHAEIERRVAQLERGMCPGCVRAANYKPDEPGHGMVCAIHGPIDGQGGSGG